MKTKTCSICDRPVWKNGKCRYHDDTQKPLVSSSNFKSTNVPLRRRSSISVPYTALKRKSPNKVENTEWGYDNQFGMFLSLWENAKKAGKVYSQISGIDITWTYGTDLWVNCFAHILNKEMWRRYKLNPNNILIVSPDEHSLLDQGTVKQRKDYETKNNCSFDLFYTKKDKLQQEYMATKGC
ncbi:hypothetical protein HN682_02705 [Candidatus Peregrinibacteria bacterium]|nr:hypothetical protein [Candidatus Peregrinibacteria bacterium]